RRNVRGWDLGRRGDVTIPRHGGVRREGRAAHRPKIDCELEMASSANAARHRSRGLDLARMPLAVVNRQRIELESVGLRDRRRRVGIQAATEKDYGFRHTPLVSGDQIY